MRWLLVLEQTTSFDHASALLRSSGAYADLTQTQYVVGFELLSTLGLVVVTDEGVTLGQGSKNLSSRRAATLLFSGILEQSRPAWLADSDQLLSNVDDLPVDVSSVAEVLGLSGGEALRAVIQVRGKIDLAERARVGAAGERALVDLLESQWPGSTAHVALEHDGLGYDVVFEHANITWSLEVKTTTRRGRLVIHTSRTEYGIGLTLPGWRLILVGLDDSGEIGALATLRSGVLQERAPSDRVVGARWESARFDLVAADLLPGLAFVDPASVDSARQQRICSGTHTLPSRFAWMPDTSQQ